MKFDIDHFNKFINRSPILSINKYYNAKSGDINIFLKNFFLDDSVQTALYNSSHNFFREVNFFLDGNYDNNHEKLNKFYCKALKYVNRICTRPTPFGGFSGCAVGNIEYETVIKKATSDEKFIRKHRLDYEFLFSLTEYLLKNTNIKKHIKYYPNNSLYIVGDKYRYVDFNIENRELDYLLSSLESNEYVDEILIKAKNGCFYDSLIEYLLEDGNEDEESENFLNDIINSKIIISEIHPNTIGDEYQYQILNVLENVIKRDGIDSKIKEIYSSLKNIIQDLDSISKKKYTINEINDITEKLKKLPLSFEVENYIQIDSLIQYQDNKISNKEIQDIKKGIRDYFRISQKSQDNRRLVEFINKFEERYDDTSVKLLEVLDPEFGIGYGDYSNEFLVITPIVDNIPIIDKTKDKSTFIWDNTLHSFLFKKIFDVHKNNLDEVVLFEDEINNFDFDIKDIPSTFVAFFNMYKTSEGYLYNLKNWSSDSATSILGRFSTLDKTFHELLSEIDDFERSKLNENQMLAEINHLSALRTGNITTRTNFRKYEIPYITVENNNGLKKINPNDIYIRVFDGKVRLFDIKSANEIIPILSNAHNYNNNPLPLYRFLSDIQNHSQINNLYLNIDLGIISTLFSYIPRIRYKNFIFRAATWSISTSEFKNIFEISEKHQRNKSLLDLLKKHKIPKKFYIAEGDNKLFLDFDSLYDVSEIIFKDELRNKNSLIIEEYIPNSFSEELEISPNEFYCNEIIVPFKNNSAEKFKHSNFNSIVSEIKKNVNINIPLGHNCFYLKIFIGTISRSKILNEKFPYFIEKLKINNLFDNWFFIRFSENNTPHLRVRFFKDKIDNNKILEIYNEIFNDEIKNDIIYKSELTLYKRENIRYGGSSMISYAEKIFEKDSEFFLSLNLFLEENKLNEYYWIFIMKTMDVYLKAFKLSDKEKAEFCIENKIYFAEKFNSNKEQTKIIMSNYKESKSFIEKIMNNVILANEYFEIAKLFDDFFNQLKEIIDKSYQNIENKKKYLMSLIHMSILRSTISKNIKHEYVLYCFLEIYFKSIIYNKNE